MKEFKNYENSDRKLIEKNKKHTNLEIKENPLNDNKKVNLKVKEINTLNSLKIILTIHIIQIHLKEN